MAVAVKPLPACHFTHACADAAIALAAPAQVRHRRHRAHQGAGAGARWSRPCASRWPTSAARPTPTTRSSRSPTWWRRASCAAASRWPSWSPRRSTDERDPAPVRPASTTRSTRARPSRATTPARCRSRCKDGRMLMHREAMNRGCADRPLSNAEIVEKFTGNARMRLSARQADGGARRRARPRRAAGRASGDRPHLPGVRALAEGGTAHMLPLSGAARHRGRAVRRRAVRQHAAGRSRRRGDQDREPGRGRRCRPRGRARISSARRRQPFLPGLQPQQEQPDAQPEASARRGDVLPRAGAHRPMRRSTTCAATSRRRSASPTTRLQELNPKIVCAHLSAYGREGPRKAWPGYDYLMQAEAGYLAADRRAGRPAEPLGPLDRRPDDRALRRLRAGLGRAVGARDRQGARHRRVACSTPRCRTSATWRSGT